MGLTQGTRLGPYEILSPLGAGGMGEVYKARDTRLDRTVAIKVLPEALAGDPEFRERFDREARAISQLDHPHICALYDIGQENGTAYLVMQYLEGETLAARLERGPLPIDQAIACAIQMADALARAHRAGIVHRDLKPGNVMLTKTGARLLDFGLAKNVPPGGAAAAMATLPTTPAGLTVQGTVVGTAPYMAPEQVEGQEADARSDIWAFGCVLYEMLSGKRAFDGRTAVGVFSAILEKDPLPIRTLRADVPQPLEWLVTRCLDKDRERRWQDAHDLALHLRAPGEFVASQTTGRAVRWREPSAWALAVLALLIAAALWLWRPGAPLAAPAFHRLSILPPSGKTFSPHQFALSPDGTRLAFVAFDEEGRSTLWVRSLDSGGTQQLADTDEAQYPFWAPDSRRVAFFARGHLRVADTGTGATRPLAEAPSGRGGSWSSSGIIVFAPNVDGPLLQIPEQGGAPRAATRVEAESGRAHRWPWFLPDGNHFLYFEEWGVTSGQEAGIYVGAVDGSIGRFVAPGMFGSVAFASGHILFAQDARLLAQPFDPSRMRLTGEAVPVFQGILRSDSAFRNSNFSVSRDGALVVQSIADSPTELVRYVESRPPQPIPGVSGTDPAVSPDGRFLAFTSSDITGRRFIHAHDFDRGSNHRVTDGGWEGTPVWTPEGRSLVYRSEDRSTYGIHERDASGSGPARRLLEGPRMTPSDYSPDGRHFAFLTFERGAPQIAMFDRRTSDVVVQHRGAEVQFHPGGEWVTFVVLGDVFMDRVGGGGPRIPISSGGGAQARWSRDGRHLYYVAPDRKIMEVPIEIRDGQARAGIARPLFQTRIVAPSYAFFQYDIRHTTPPEFIVSSLKPDAPLTFVSNWPGLLPK